MNENSTLRRKEIVVVVAELYLVMYHFNYNLFLILLTMSKTIKTNKFPKKKKN